MRVAFPLLCLLSVVASAQTPGFSPDPEAAHLVTGDLDRFWSAWDEAEAQSDKVSLRRTSMESACRYHYDTSS